FCHQLAEILLVVAVFQAAAVAGLFVQAYIKGRAPLFEALIVKKAVATLVTVDFIDQEAVEIRRTEEMSPEICPSPLVKGQIVGGAVFGLKAFDVHHLQLAEGEVS